MNKEKKDKPKSRLLTVENKLMVSRVGEVGMGEIGEGDLDYTYHDECWIICRIVESLHCTPES